MMVNAFIFNTKLIEIETKDSESESNKFESLEMWSNKRDTFADLGANAEQQRMGFQKPIDLSIINRKPTSQIIKTTS